MPKDIGKFNFQFSNAEDFFRHLLKAREKLWLYRFSHHCQGYSHQHPCCPWRCHWYHWSPSRHHLPLKGCSTGWPHLTPRWPWWHCTWPGPRRHPCQLPPTSGYFWMWTWMTSGVGTLSLVHQLFFSELMDNDSLIDPPGDVKNYTVRPRTWTNNSPATSINLCKWIF